MFRPEPRSSVTAAAVITSRFTESTAKTACSPVKSAWSTPVVVLSQSVSHLFFNLGKIAVGCVCRPFVTAVDSCSVSSRHVGYECFLIGLANSAAITTFLSAWITATRASV